MARPDGPADSGIVVAMGGIVQRLHVRIFHDRVLVRALRRWKSCTHCVNVSMREVAEELLGPESCKHFVLKK